MPTRDGHFALTGGLAMADLRNNDGFENKGRGWTLRPIMRFGGVEVSPFASQSTFYMNVQHPLVTVGENYLPQQPPRRFYLGQDWARGKNVNNQYGATIKAAVTNRLSFRAGMFRGEADRHRNFTEIFSIVDPSGLANHRLIADPMQRLHTTSGEAQVAYRVAAAAGSTASSLDTGRATAIPNPEAPTRAASARWSMAGSILSQSPSSRSHR